MSWAGTSMQRETQNHGSLAPILLTGNELQVYEQKPLDGYSMDCTLSSPKRYKFDRILLPEDLINQNRNEIAGTAGSNNIREIELKNGIYTLTLTEGSTERILAFNATTGVLIA